jgi:hypothetical protein
MAGVSLRNSPFSPFSESSEVSEILHSPYRGEEENGGVSGELPLLTPSAWNTPNRTTWSTRNPPTWWTPRPAAPAVLSKEST